MAEVKRRRVSWSGDEAQHDLWTTQYSALRKLGKATVARWAEGPAVTGAPSKAPNHNEQEQR